MEGKRELIRYQKQKEQETYSENFGSYCRFPCIVFGYRWSGGINYLGYLFVVVFLPVMGGVRWFCAFALRWLEEVA